MYISLYNPCDSLRDMLPIAQFKNVKNTHAGMLLLVKFTKSSTPRCVFFTFFELYKWHQMAYENLKTLNSLTITSTQLVI